MHAKNFVVNRGVSCFIRGVSCFIRGVSCFIRGVSCFIRCILSCFIRCNPVFQSWSSRRERVKSISEPNFTKSERFKVSFGQFLWKIILSTSCQKSSKKFYFFGKMVNKNMRQFGVAHEI